MEVLAVSTATPQWQDVNGKQSFTSIVRSPQPNGIIQTTQTGHKRDRNTVHEGPLYAFFAHHYDYWCERLGVDRKAWDWCHWGENITFSCGDPNLNEHDFHLGDVWQIGDSVKLKVCGARVPSSKLSWRCGQNDSWLRPLADSGFCGVYFSVLQGGKIQVGDKACRIEKRHDTMDCGSISRIAFERSLKPRDTRNLLHNNELLSSMLQVSSRHDVSLINNRQREGSNAWKGWRRFRPASIVNEGGGVVSFYLKALDGESLASYTPGQCLTVRLPTGDIRSWSISDWPQNPDAPDYYRISIKQSHNASVWMTTRCTLDTVLEVRSPRGHFCLSTLPRLPPRQVYITAGVGIMPIFSMMKAQKTLPAMQRTDALWIHVARNGAEIPFLDELADLPPSLKPIWCFTAPREHEELGRDYDVRGRPEKQLLATLLAPGYRMRLAKTALPVEGRLSAFYICVPEAFEQDIRSALASLDVPAAMIKSEVF